MVNLNEFSPIFWKSASLSLQGGISSSILSVFFTDKFALSQSDARISVAYNSCQWKTLTKRLMKCPPDIRKQPQTSLESIERQFEIQRLMITRGSYVHKPMVKFFWGASRKCLFLQIFRWFQTKQFARILEFIKLYKQNPSENIFIFTIHQNYTLALTTVSLSFCITESASPWCGEPGADVWDAGARLCCHGEAERRHVGDDSIQRPWQIVWEGY